MSPRTPQQYQEMREEKMTLIMDVALEHFASEGYFKTTINHIARHAGMSKGLMYNYFESKEALLKAIVHRSVNEVYRYLDINRDGYLSEEEFDFFIRKINVLLREKRSFWRLLMQLVMQKDVEKQFLVVFQQPDSFIHPGHEPGDNYYPSRIMKLLTDYFLNKKSRMGKSYDPETDLEMFTTVLVGYAVKTIYSDNDDQSERAINMIIRLFK